MNIIDWKEFDIIKPKSRKDTMMVITITSSGEIRLNTALLKEIKTNAAEFRLKKDGKMLAVLPSGKQLLSFNKNGSIKNYSLVEKLDAVRVKLPAYYTFGYDNENQAFIGNYCAYNPNSRRSKDK